MKSTIHLIDVTDFTLLDGTKSADWFGDAFRTLGLLDMIELVSYDGVGGELPEVAQASAPGGGVIVTGSSGAVFEHKPWIPPLLDFLRAAHAQEAAILGVCFGHHALAVALGGEVQWNVRGREMGTLPIYLTEEGKRSPIFRGFNSGDLVNLSHRTQVVRLPAGAARLAFNQMTSTQAFQIGRSFGVQPHPEFTPTVLRLLVERYAPLLIAKEHFLDDREHLANFVDTFADCPSARLVLRNFLEIASGAGR
jgi:GMP synthase-like glutamine amidotransferase